MKNLHATLNDERNAHARYLGFAQEADGEGYGAVASLFRAVAASDGVYGNSHEQTIWRLKGELSGESRREVDSRESPSFHFWCSSPILYVSNFRHPSTARSLRSGHCDVRQCATDRNGAREIVCRSCQRILKASRDQDNARTTCVLSVGSRLPN